MILRITGLRVDSSPHEMIAKMENLAKDPAAFPGEKANAAAMAAKLREKHGIHGPVNLGGGAKKVKHPGSHGGHFYGFTKSGNPKYGKPGGTYYQKKPGPDPFAKTQTKWKGNRVGQTSNGKGIYDWYMPREDYSPKDHREAADHLRKMREKPGTTGSQKHQYTTAANLHEQAANEKEGKASDAKSTYTTANFTAADLAHADKRLKSFLAKGGEKADAAIQNRTKKTSTPTKLAAWIHILKLNGQHKHAGEAMAKLNSMGFTV